jgi:hypothetical protein
MRGLLAGAVLPVTDLLQPIHNFAVELLLNCDMCHGCCERGPVPVFFARRKPDYVSGADLFDGRAFALSPAAAGRDDQRLAERVGVPCGSGARFEGDACSLNQCGLGGLEERIDTNCAGEPIGRSFGGGLRAAAFDLHAQMICQTWTVVIVSLWMG